MYNILWAEDEAQYVDDVTDELRERYNIGSKVVENCAAMLEDLESLDKSVRVIILDLWLPEGDNPRGMPDNLKSQKQNTARGLWLCDQVLRRLRELERDIPILILSGNADVDVISKLEAKGIPSDHLWKKPTEFFPFVNVIAGLVNR